MPRRRISVGAVDAAGACMMRRRWPGAQRHYSPSDGVTGVTIKLGVLALAGPDNGGTYQYTLSMLQALRHANGFEITLYGNPQNPDFAELGSRICEFWGSRLPQLPALPADRLHIRLPDPFMSQDILLAPIYALAL